MRPISEPMQYKSDQIQMKQDVFSKHVKVLTSIARKISRDIKNGKNKKKLNIEQILITIKSKKENKTAI